MKTSRTTIVVCYLLIYFVWGSTYLALGISIKSAPIFFASGVRFLTAGLILVAATLAGGVEKPTRGNIVTALKSGILSFSVSYSLLSWAGTVLPSSTAALIISLDPAWFIIVDWLLFSGPKPSRHILLSLGAGVTGCVVLVMSGGTAAPDEPIAAKYVFAASAVVLTGFSWVYGTLLASKSRKSHPNPLMASGLQMTIGGGVLTAISAYKGDFSRVGEISPESWLAILYLTVFGSLVAYSAYLTLMRCEPTSRVVTHAFVNPVVAVILGVAFGGETVTIYTFIAALLIVTSVIGIIRNPGFSA